MRDGLAVGPQPAWWSPAVTAAMLPPGGLDRW